MRSRSRPTSVTLAILATIILVMPVAAADPWVTFKQTGTNAFAFSSECTDNPGPTVTCSGESLDVIEGSMKQSGQPTRSGQQVCYSDFTDTFNPRTGESVESRSLFGCTFDAGTLTINNLTSITLAPTVIELTLFECDGPECTESPGGSTTVSGTWTGVGPTVTQKSRFTFDDGTCIQVNADRGSFRQATFEGSIEAMDARIGEGTFTFRTNCVFGPPPA
jgi:hypothetical protein